jgi:hypothetical protein
MEYDPSGKIVPGVQSFLLISASATDMLSTNPILPQTISIGSQGNLGSSSNLLVALPNGKTDVTPKAAGRAWYGFTINGTTFTPQITVNNVLIGPNTPPPTNCVGQQLTFSLGFSPTVPLTNVVANWTLPAGFVNASSTNSAGCVIYTNNPNLLHGPSNTCQCWYSNSLGGTVSVRANMIIGGKSYKAGTFGQFSIYRPSLVHFQPPYYVAT